MRKLVLLVLLAAFAVLGARAFAADAPRPSTAGPRVALAEDPPVLPSLGAARTLRVYLPPGYHTSDKRYPVLYMFDGQNLYDAATSYAGEWGVDETMDALAVDAGFEAIVVGIDHGNERRVNELVPFENAKLAPNEGVAFVRDVAEVVKPWVDAHYRTRPDREHTAILGSSLGGLSAAYAIHAHPGVFGKAGVFSPSFWVSDQAYTQARGPLPGDARIWLSMGDREGRQAVRDVRRYAKVLGEVRAPAQWTLRIEPEAEHNEAAWRGEFPRAVRWLYALGEAK